MYDFNYWILILAITLKIKWLSTFDGYMRAILSQYKSIFAIVKNDDCQIHNFMLVYLTIY